MTNKSLISEIEKQSGSVTRTLMLVWIGYSSECVHRSAGQGYPLLSDSLSFCVCASSSLKTQKKYKS